MIELYFSSSGLLTTSTRMLLAFSTSLFLFLFFGKRAIELLRAKKIGQPIRDDEGFLLAELHKNKKNTPTMGGLFISIGTLISAFLWTDITEPFILILIIATTLFSGVGAVDDWAKLRNQSSLGISGRSRMVIQTLFSVVLMLYLSTENVVHPSVLWRGLAISWGEWQSAVLIPFCTGPLFITSFLGLLISYSIQWLTITGTANAVNLTDGLDGLAAGLALFVTLFLAGFSFLSNSPRLAELHGLFSMHSSGEISVYLCGMAGALIGFLWYNAYPAELFMGDTGSLGIGGTIGTASVLLRCEWYLALVGFIFVAEALSVILQILSFKMTGKRIFRCAPLHHHFEYSGLHESKVVVRFWITGLLLVVIGLLSLKMDYIWIKL
ncbi:MAG: phospho-N-acetylmuramoyl-pentapeptide-transferase [Chlamydia sp.]